MQKNDKHRKKFVEESNQLQSGCGCGMINTKKKVVRRCKYRGKRYEDAFNCR